MTENMEKEIAELMQLVDAKDACIEKAEELAKIEDVNLAQFYFNAAKGYDIKIEKYFERVESEA